MYLYTEKQKMQNIPQQLTVNLPPALLYTLVYY